MKLLQLGYGIATFLPGARMLRARGTGGTLSARYCYSVWLRHLSMAHQHGLNTQPEIVAELGPGDSLGIGLAALLSGVEQCYAMDVVDHANLTRNLQIFDDLVTLFAERTAIPDDTEFPLVKPYLDDYSFPEHLFSPGQLDAALTPDRVARIRQSLMNASAADSMIRYQVPWYEASVVQPLSVDMIYSQAVMEHVDDLAGTYQAMRAWLKDDGFISHQIDFKCHGTADEWNGHWTYSDLHWKLIRGRRHYLLNRQPHSVHLSTAADNGFRVVCDKTVTTPSKYSRDQLAPRFRSMTDEDLTTSGAFIQAVKSDTA